MKSKDEIYNKINELSLKCNGNTQLKFMPKDIIKMNSMLEVLNWVLE